MLKVSTLCVKGPRHLIVPKTSLRVSAGETLAITGPSGCGKTTLLKAVAGFIGRIEGEISFHQTVWQNEHGSYLSASKRPCTLLFQELAIWPHLSVGSQLAMVAAYPSGFIQSLDLNENTLGRHLSGGEKQRLALGRLLLTKSSILLLDEPFASLDHARKKAMIRLLREHQHKHNCAILIATHDQTDVQALGASVHSLSRC